MSALRNWRNFPLLLTVSLFTGCASTGAIHTTTPITVKLANYKTVLLYVYSQVPESSGEAMQLASFITAKLSDKELFEKIRVASTCPECPGCRAALRLDANMVELKKVDSGGRAEVVVDVALTDMNTGTSVGSFKAEGKSSGRTVLARTTSQASEHAAGKIVRFVGKHM